VFNQQDYERWLPVKNVGASEVPAYGAMQVDGYESSTGAVQVKRPTKDDMDPAMVLLNGGVALAAGEYGQGRIADPSLAYVSGSPAVGDELGTVQDQYYLSTGKKGFLAWSTVAGAGTGAAALVVGGPKSLVGVVCGTGASAGSLVETRLSTA
jgi:hypothetical protein